MTDQSSAPAIGSGIRYVLALKRRIRNLRAMVDEERKRPVADSDRIDRLKRQLDEAEREVFESVSTIHPT